MTWKMAAGETDVPVGTVKKCNAEGKEFLLFHLADGFYATDPKCTHLNGPLAKGKIIDGCKIRCPFHRAEFDIKTGEVANWANFPPGIQLLNFVRGEKKLGTYKTQVRDQQVWVDID